MYQCGIHWMHKKILDPTNINTLTVRTKWEFLIVAEKMVLLFFVAILRFRMPCFSSKLRTKGFPPTQVQLYASCS